MNPFSVRPRPSPSSFAWRVILTITVLVGTTILAVLGWPRWNSRVLAPDRMLAASTSSNSSPTSASSGSSTKFQETAAYWREHKDHLRKLLAVDYPAALARRNSAAPDLESVIKFGKEYSDRFERDHHDIYLRAEEQDKLHRAKMEEIEAHGRGIAADLLLYERWLADTRPIAGNLTISDLARLHGLGNPDGLTFLHRVVAGTERRAFQDEVAAKQAESLQTPQEMVDYILAARPRWEAELMQIHTEAGYDVEVGEYLLGSQCAAMVNVLTRNYQRESNKELDAIAGENDAILQAMHEPELAAASRDDPEARQLLTELQRMLLLRQMEKPGP